MFLDLGNTKTIYYKPESKLTITTKHPLVFYGVTISDERNLQQQFL